MAEEHIKINPVPTKVKYSGNGVVREFPTGFAFFENDNIVVYHNGFVINTGYSITGVGETNGGVVTFDVAPDEGDKIVILRKVDIERVTDFQEGGAFRAKNINDELDRQTAFCQQIQEEIERCVKVTVTDEQTPEELLSEVYGKLDSATAIAGDAINAANQAQTAADNAMEAVNQAEQTLTEVINYVDTAKTDIEDTKNTAIGAIDSTVLNAKADINTAVDEATMNITDIVSDAEGSITNIAVTEANKAIANAAQEATDTATANLNSYVDGTVKPSLQTYVDQAQADANSAATSMEQAALSATAASNYASNASADADNAAESATHAATSATDSEHYSEDSRIWAEGTDSEVQGLGGVHSSKVWSEIVKGAITTVEGAVGDIGFAPLGIDETQNKRRYLNGQVISQTQFVTFADKVKAAVALYPSLSATEENWQAEVTNSPYGICGKFVIDDEAGTIRLPKYPEWQSRNIAEIPVVGNGISIGLNDGINNFGIQVGSGQPFIYTQTDSYGVETGTSNTGNQNTSRNKVIGVTTDPTKSGIIADLTQVTEEDKIAGNWFIQVATGSEKSVDVSTEIQLNNPFSLLDYKWSEYEITNTSWLLSNGQFNSGVTYISVYNLLLKIYNGTETKDGVSVKLSTEAYEDTDFVLNTTDTTFRLPIKVSNTPVSGLVPIVGTNNAGSSTAQANLVGKELFVSMATSQHSYTRMVATDGSGELGNTATIGISADLDKVTNTSLKLYFYVGETIQDANVINAAGVLTRVTNSIDRTVASDRETVVGWGMPDYSAGISISSGYVAVYDGWVKNNYIISYGTFNLSINGITMYNWSTEGAWYTVNQGLHPVKKGDVIVFNGSGIFYPCKGVN